MRLTKKQDRLCVHYGDGVCNVTLDRKDFYAEYIKSSYSLPVLYYNMED